MSRAVSGQAGHDPDGRQSTRATTGTITRAIAQIETFFNYLRIGVTIPTMPWSNVPRITSITIIP